MFDLTTGKVAHIPSTPAVPILLSVGLQVSIVGTLLGATVLLVGNPIPDVPQMMSAFVAAPPPPPPPPAPPAARPPAAKEVAASPINPDAAPIAPPTEIAPEPATAAVFDDEGFIGGVPGGVSGGVLAGIGGGSIEGVPPPPPPPRMPVRVGGDVKAPALVHRVEPIYPAIAVQAQVQGTVILEASVNESGVVEDVRVLRSNKLLDNAAIDAVRQWRYSPLMLNGRPTPFVLTVVLTFGLK